MARRAQWRSFAHAKCDVDDALATTFALAKSVEVAVPRGRRDDEDAIARALDDGADAIVGTHFEAEMSIADALDAHFVHEHVRRWTAAKTKTKTRRRRRDVWADDDRRRGRFGRLFLRDAEGTVRGVAHGGREGKFGDANDGATRAGRRSRA